MSFIFRRSAYELHEPILFSWPTSYLIASYISVFRSPSRTLRPPNKCTPVWDINVLLLVFFVCCSFRLIGSWLVPLRKYSSSKFPSFTPPTHTIPPSSVHFSFFFVFYFIFNFNISMISPLLLYGDFDRFRSKMTASLTLRRLWPSEWELRKVSPLFLIESCSLPRLAWVLFILLFLYSICHIFLYIIDSQNVYYPPPPSDASVAADQCGGLHTLHGWNARHIYWQAASQQRHGQYRPHT